MDRIKACNIRDGCSCQIIPPTNPFLGMDLPGLVFVVWPGKSGPRTGFACAYDICKFVNYSITKNNRFQSLNNQQKHTFGQYQIKLGFM